MKKEMRELMEIFEKFHKLNIASMLPELTQGEFAVLKAVECCRESRGKEVRISDIVGHMHVLAPSVSRSMKSLEDRGLILRETDKKDRRNVYVMLTGAGAQKLEEAEQILSEFHQAVFESIGEENLNRMVQYLYEIIDVMAIEIERRKCKKK